MLPGTVLHSGLSCNQPVIPAMPRTIEPITVALLALPATTAATLYGFFDALASVRRDWRMLHGQPPADSPFRPLVVSEA